MVTDELFFAEKKSERVILDTEGMKRSVMNFVEEKINIGIFFQ